MQIIIVGDSEEGKQKCQISHPTKIGIAENMASNKRNGSNATHAAAQQLDLDDFATVPSRNHSDQNKRSQKTRSKRSNKNNKQVDEDGGKQKSRKKRRSQNYSKKKPNPPSNIKNKQSMISTDAKNANDENSNFNLNLTTKNEVKNRQEGGGSKKRKTPRESKNSNESFTNINSKKYTKTTDSKECDDFDNDEFGEYSSSYYRSLKKTDNYDDEDTRPNRDEQLERENETANATTISLKLYYSTSYYKRMQLNEHEQQIVSPTQNIAAPILESAVSYDNIHAQLEENREDGSESQYSISASKDQIHPTEMRLDDRLSFVEDSMTMSIDHRRSSDDIDTAKKDTEDDASFQMQESQENTSESSSTKNDFRKGFIVQKVLLDNDLEKVEDEVASSTYSNDNITSSAKEVGQCSKGTHPVQPTPYIVEKTKSMHMNFHGLNLKSSDEQQNCGNSTGSNIEKVIQTMEESTAIPRNDYEILSSKYYEDENSNHDGKELLGSRANSSQDKCQCSCVVM